MTISAVSEKWLIAAAVVATAAVFQVRQWVRRAQARMRRRRDLFQVLIVTSTEKMSADHVRALNMIDLEFDGIRALGQHVQSNLEQTVCERWHTYRDHLNRRAPGGGQRSSSMGPERRWVAGRPARNDECLAGRGLYC